MYLKLSTYGPTYLSLLIQWFSELKCINGIKDQNCCWQLVIKKDKTYIVTLNVHPLLYLFSYQKKIVICSWNSTPLSKKDKYISEIWQDQINPPLE